LPKIILNEIKIDVVSNTEHNETIIQIERIFRRLDFIFASGHSGI